MTIIDEQRAGNNIPESVQLLLADSPDMAVREALAGNNCTTEAVQLILARDVDVSTLRRLGQVTRFESVQLQLVDHHHELVRAPIARNKQLCVHAQYILMCDKSIYIRQILAVNECLRLDVAMGLLVDPEKSVRDMVLARASTVPGLVDAIDNTAEKRILKFIAEHTENPDGS